MDTTITHFKHICPNCSQIWGHSRCTGSFSGIAETYCWECVVAAVLSKNEIAAYWQYPTKYYGSTGQRVHVLTAAQASKIDGYFD